MRRNNSSEKVRRLVALNVRRLRKDAKLSQQELSDMVGMNRTYLSDIENAKGNASVDVLVKIADGLDVPITDFFKGTEASPPYKL